MLHWVLLTATIAAGEPVAAPASLIQPEIIETRSVNLTQTVTLKDIPAGAQKVRLWVPVPSDGPWQRVVNRQVVSAPEKWRLKVQGQGRGDFVYVEVDSPKEQSISVVLTCTVEREGVHFPLEQAQSQSGDSLQRQWFYDDLDKRAPLMEVDERIKVMAKNACGDETDVAKQAMLLMKLVSDVADHYSKDPSKPTCGRGSASDCMDHGGGCCTDLHSLFIALARARGIPARIQYGYRLLDAKAGPADYDPGYRCWVEFYVPGAGWVPTDVVAADNADQANPLRWASLSAERVWLWQGRSFELQPKAAAGPIDTMLCGWAEIDGKPVDVLPAADGTPSKLSRTVRFEIVNTTRKPDAPKLPS